MVDDLRSDDGLGNAPERVRRSEKAPHDHRPLTDREVPITPDHEYVLCFTKTPGAQGFKQRQDASILDAYRPPDSESDRPYRDRLLKKKRKKQSSVGSALDVLSNCRPRWHRSSSHT